MLLPATRAVTSPGALSQAAQELCYLRQALTLLPTAFQLLDCTDLGHITDHILSILQCHLQSESLLLWRMAITCLITLSQRPEKVSRSSWAQ